MNINDIPEHITDKMDALYTKLRVIRQSILDEAKSRGRHIEYEAATTTATVLLLAELLDRIEDLEQQIQDDDFLKEQGLT